MDKVLFSSGELLQLHDSCQLDTAPAMNKSPYDRKIEVPFKWLKGNDGHEYFSSVPLGYSEYSQQYKIDFAVMRVARKRRSKQCYA